MRNRQFIGYTLGPLERNVHCVGDDYLILRRGGAVKFCLDRIYFRHGLDREIYFHMA